MSRRRRARNPRGRNQATGTGTGTRTGTGTSHPAPLNRHVLLYSAVIIVATAVVYAGSLSAPFIFDDEYAVVQNPAIRSLAGAWVQPRNTPLAGRPVAGLTFAISFAAHELEPGGYRATNIAIHMGCALLLFGLLRRLLVLPRLITRFGHAAPDLAFAVALLWVVHPLTTDAVTYVTQRTESLMGFCYLLALYASVRSHSGTSTHKPRSAILWGVMAVAACALGMGVKESMVTAPLMVVLVDRIFLFDSFRQAIASRWRLYLCLALTWVVLAIQAVSAPRSGSAGFETGIGAWTYLLNQTVMIVRYLRLSVWPVDLAITYGHPVPYGLADVLPYAVMVSALLLLTVAALKWSATAAFLGLWFFITLAPSSSVVPIATEVGAERRMYLPLMALVAAAVLGLYNWRLVRDRASHQLAAAAVIAVAAALGTQTIRRNTEHQSWLTLARTTLERWPTDAAHAAVGSELSRLRRDGDALPLLRIGARSDPRARYNLGIALFNLKHYDAAIRELDVLASEHPMREEVPWARRVMGHAYSRLGRWPEAITQFRMTLTMKPGDADARRLLVDASNSHGVELAEAHRYDEAITQFRNALSHADGNAAARYNLATALFDSGRLKEALAEAERALALDQANGDAHHLLGKLLALHGRFDESIDHLEAAAALRPDDPAIREDLARVRRVR